MTVFSKAIFASHYSIMCWQISRYAPIFETWDSFEIVSKSALQNILIVEGILGTLWHIWSINASIESVMYLTIWPKLPELFDDFFSYIDAPISSILVEDDELISELSFLISSS